MKKSLSILVCLYGGILCAQQPWLTNAEEAFALAADRDLPVLMVFSGSDWCKPCIKLHQEVFDRPEFVSFAEEKFVLLKVDFPKSRRNRLSPELQAQNNDLAATWNPHGEFPLVVVLTGDKTLLFTTGYRSGGADLYQQHLLDQLTAHVATP